MELQNGDWVRTEKGEVCQVVMMSRLSACVEFNVVDQDPLEVSYLTSQLTKIDPPKEAGSN
jgi:hypothetical protein